MLTLVADGAESLWDELLPVEVRALPDDLAALDVLLCDPELLVPFAIRWEHELAETGRFSDRGRPTLAMETYVRLMVLKQRYGWGYGTLVPEVSDSIHLRRFCRLGLSQRVPDESTVRKFTRRLGAEVVHQAHARVDWEGPAREAVSSAGGADRLDRGRGRHSLSDGLGAGGRRGQGAGPGGSQAGGQDRRQAHRGEGSLARGRPPAARDHAHDASPLRASQGGGAQADQADRPAACQVGQGGAAAGRRGQAPGPGARRPGQAQGRASARAAGRPLREGRRADHQACQGREDHRPADVAVGSRRPADPQGQALAAQPIRLRRSALRDHREHQAGRTRVHPARPQARSATRARTRCCRPPQPSCRTSGSSCAR